MNWLRHTKIYGKLMTLIVVTIFFLVIIGCTGYYYMGCMYNSAKKVYQDSMKPAVWINTAKANSRGAEADTWKIIFSTDKLEQEQLRKDIQHRTDETNKMLSDYAKSGLQTEAKEKLLTLQTTLATFRSERQKVVDLAIAGRRQEAYNQFKAALPKLDELNNLMQYLSENEDTQAQKLEREVSQSFAQAVSIVIGLALLGVLICLALGLFIARIIVNPVNQLQNLMAKAGDGDLTVRGEVSSRDEIGNLLASFNQMTRRQAELVGAVRQSVLDLSAASEEMAATCETVSAATQEVGNSMEELTQEAQEGDKAVVEASQTLVHLSSLIQIAKSRAEAAVADSTSTLRIANVGQSTVQETVERMSVIRAKTKETEQVIATLNQYSEQIALITETITNIAEQTNLLALNAAIEAARAGDAGWGFAVVAEEVRKLAEQSNHGAGEVAQLVQKVVESTNLAVDVMRQNYTEVEEGVIVANRAGSALEEIVTAVNGTVEDINGVLAVTNDEVASSDQIVKLINNTALVIEATERHAELVTAALQETLASMETVSASAEEGSAMAEELNSLVEVFHVPVDNIMEGTKK